MSINLSTSFKFTLSFAAVAGLLLGCGEKPTPAEAKPDKLAEYQQQIRDLTAERDRLKAEVQELSRSPSVILADLTSALASKDASKAEKAQAELEKRFPKTTEAADGKKQIATYRDGLAKAAAEEHRLAALGFKALPASLSIKGPAVTAKFGDLSFAARFVMDRYDDTYHYRDADRDAKYAVMSMSVTAGKGVSNPELPGAALYWADGATLKKLGDFSVEFTRWESYATYLGNYSDSRNDFAKVQTIPFALGVQITDEEVKKRPLYVVATKEGCISRRYERFRNPPDYYLGVCTPLKSTLTVKDFSDSDGKLAVILRRD
ncbi:MULTISPECIES: hypothetical protein [unclassified Acidovorax]|jgi:outer membrane murein-binding lipoprotein Lpp|uniref:hypothetical protein n=1 Tax=unclassified Acidovorax TaxID=2684926 RepID=UPI000BD26CF4|nr:MULTISPECIES: hypothetical protein [unclassified Acidovorax]OZA58691.1 MAG: hypothetical protein B7X79_01090 [Acidovorax sp. 17-64-282]HQT50997.1 hypothetical protein [Acidovorax defluvii]OYY26276.1 MAG: hypothetical protein B7Y64_16565 [Acidovorax sp. 35-64-16]OYZ45065.1 MAG: hypothetical protein B7Y20_08690 [Acidovorax sp. 16-64-162]OYZ66572.1 MAG: hypothetical protein B7Y14_16985 [Acidovorax sp. 24-64-9]